MFSLKKSCVFWGKYTFFAERECIEFNTVNTSQPFVTIYFFQSGLVRSGLHRLVLASVQRSAAGSYCCQVASSTFASSILPIVLKVTASIIMVVIIIIIREMLLSSLFQVTLASPPFYTEDSASTLQVLGDHLLSFKHHRHHLIACIKFIIYRI